MKIRREDVIQNLKDVGLRENEIMRCMSWFDAVSYTHLDVYKRQVEDGAKDYEVTVEFDKAGQKKMFASFAKLKKI